MADEQIIDPVTPPEAQPSRAEERITQLSEKVKIEAEGKQAAEARATAAERKAAFAEGYAEILGTYPAAKEHKADIESKVTAGLSVEDATFAVLGKAGKLGAQAPAPISPAGGSAPNAITGSAEKPVSEMTQTEKRAELEKTLIWDN